MEEFNALQIIGKDYSNLQPQQPKYNAICVFDFETARIVFSYGFCDFVIVLNEITGNFRKCFNLMEVELFLNEKYDNNNLSPISEYPYEIFIDDENSPFEINSWIPITMERIKNVDRIDEYIANGLLRKRK